MLVKTILNRCERFKCFVYGQVRFVTQAGRDRLDVEVKPRKGSAALCSCCHQAAPCYDHASNHARANGTKRRLATVHFFAGRSLIPSV